MRSQPIPSRCRCHSPICFGGKQKDKKREERVQEENQMFISVIIVLTKCYKLFHSFPLVCFHVLFFPFIKINLKSSQITTILSYYNTHGGVGQGRGHMVGEQKDHLHPYLCFNVECHYHSLPLKYKPNLLTSGGTDRQT